MDFARFYDFLPSGLEAKPGLIEHIISLFFAISIEVKKGDIQPDDIPKIFLIDSLTRAPGQEPNPVQRINAKYPVTGMYHQPFDAIYLQQFFKNGTLDKAAIAISIEYSIFFSEERRAN